MNDSKKKFSQSKTSATNARYSFFWNYLAGIVFLFWIPELIYISGRISFLVFLVYYAIMFLVFTFFFLLFTYRNIKYLSFSNSKSFIVSRDKIILNKDEFKLKEIKYDFIIGYKVKVHSSQKGKNQGTIILKTVKLEKNGMFPKFKSREVCLANLENLKEGVEEVKGLITDYYDLEEVIRQMKNK